MSCAINVYTSLKYSLFSLLNTSTVLQHTFMVGGWGLGGGNQTGSKQRISGIEFVMLSKPTTESQDIFSRCKRNNVKQFETLGEGNVSTANGKLPKFDPFC